MENISSAKLAPEALLAKPGGVALPCQDPVATMTGTLSPIDSIDLSGRKLLEPLWCSPELYHQIGVMNRQTPFRNRPVKSVGDALEQAAALSAAGSDVYFALAEYGSPANRKATNAIRARSLCMDFDCSPEKAERGKGYATIQLALSALCQFCADMGLAPPTLRVDSGGGLHVYWVLDEPIARKVWQSVARKFSALAKQHGLLADPARTADIASVLRIPGTWNYKYMPPRPVRLVYASDQLIERDDMLRSIDLAYATHCEATARPTATGKVTGIGARLAKSPETSFGRPKLDELAWALAFLDPDCDEPTWTLRRIAPLAGAARQYPALERELRALAKAWSSGELRGRPSSAWNTPGRTNGKTGEMVFPMVWQRFLNETRHGPRATLGTIYHDAHEARYAKSATAGRQRPQALH